MRLTYFFILFCLTFGAKAQKVSDLSIDLYDLVLRKRLDLSYERELSPKISLIADIKYGQGRTLFFDTDERDTTTFLGIEQITPVQEYSKTQEFLVALGGRYYFKPKRGIDRFFLGAGLLYATKTKIEENYPYDSPNDRLYLQTEIGYKFLINNKIPVELGYLMFFGQEGNGSYNYFAVDAELLLKIGYRFGSKPLE